MEDWAVKHRPQLLKDLIGQDVNKEMLETLVRSNRLFGAMIFYGRSGCGKTTTARILGNEMNAEVVELDAASNNGVEDARNIKDIASKLALTGKHKIIIIDEAHMLSKAAWNALLKAVEEPNDKTHFIFCTTEYTAIPSTIRGRSQMFKFYSIPIEDQVKYANYILQQEGKQLDDDCIALAIKQSKGQMRDLLKILQRAVEQGCRTAEQLRKALELPSAQGMGSYLQGVLSGDSKLAVRALKSITSDLIEWKKALEDLIYDVLEDKYGISELSYSVTQTAKLRELASTYRPQAFGKILDYLLRVDKSETAYQMLYVLATVGVDEL